MKGYKNQIHGATVTMPDLRIAGSKLKDFHGFFQVILRTLYHTDIPFKKAVLCVEYNIMTGCARPRL